MWYLTTFDRHIVQAKCGGRRENVSELYKWPNNCDLFKWQVRHIGLVVSSEGVKIQLKERERGSQSFLRGLE